MPCYPSHVSAVTSRDDSRFNVKAGRCEACEGDGMKRIEMNFLRMFMCSVIFVAVPLQPRTLAVKYKRKVDAELL